MAVWGLRLKYIKKEDVFGAGKYITLEHFQSKNRTLGGLVSESFMDYQEKQPIFKFSLMDY